MLRMWHFLDVFKETHATLKLVNRRNGLKVLKETSQPLRAVASEQFPFPPVRHWNTFWFSAFCEEEPCNHHRKSTWLTLTYWKDEIISKSKQLSKIIFSHHCLTKTFPNVNMDCILLSLGTSWQAWLTHVEQSKRIFPSLVICFSILLMVTTWQQRAQCFKLPGRLL